MTPEGNVESVMLREHIDALLGDLKREGASGYCTSFWAGRRTSKNIGRSWKRVQRNQRAYPSDRRKALRKLRNPVRSKRIRDFL